MATRGKPPQRGEHHVTYTFDKCPPGHECSGWLAGPLHGILGHSQGPTKPCFKWLYGDSYPCPGCADGNDTRPQFYVPLRRHDGRPVAIILGEGAHPVADRIRPGAVVCWGRNPGVGENVWLLEWRGLQPWRYYWPAMPPNADLAPWLVRLWRMPDILPALRARWDAECQPVVTPDPEPAEVIPDDVPTDPALNADWARAVRESKLARDGVGDLGSALPKIGSPKPNGKPPKK